MAKRTSETSPRSTTIDPPLKRTRNRAEQGSNIKTNSVSRNGESKTVELSDTETTGPTTPQEWEKSENEHEKPVRPSAATLGSVDPSMRVNVGIVALPTNLGNPDVPVTLNPSVAASNGTSNKAAEAVLVNAGTSDIPAASNTTVVAQTAQATTDAVRTAGPTVLDALPPSTPAVSGSPTPPNPTMDDIKALFKDIDYVPEGDKCRMLSFARKNDDVNLRYAISQVPSHAKWGSTTKTSKFLCIDNKPITVWAIGDVETTWFRDLQGNPHDRVNVGFKLPFVHDSEGLRHLYSLARPVRDVDDVVYAGRRMVVYRKGESMPTILPFNDVFDARKRFQAKSQMPRLETSAIGKRDVVLVEGKFTRWNAAKDKRNKREWKLWGVGFELEAISLLYEAPADVDPQPAVELADIDDDM